jgi:hypothetical protein
MNKDINAVLFYLAGKNYFNGAAEIGRDLNDDIDIEAALTEMENMGLVHTKTENDDRKVYILKQFVKDGIHNLPLEFSQDPYTYFKQLDLEKQRIVTKHKDYVGTLAQVKGSGSKDKSRMKVVVGIVAGILTTAITFIKWKGKK